MCPDLNTLYESIYIEIRKLNREWQIFQELFTESEERIKILSNTAGTFFYIIQELLKESVFLTISRLTDPKMSAGKENLSLEKLVSELESSGDSKLAKELALELTKIKDNSEPIRKWRNKKLSHADLQKSTNPKFNPLPPVLLGTLDKIFIQINEFSNAIAKELGKPYVLHEKAIIEGGVEDLEMYLRIGLSKNEFKGG